MKKYIPVLVLFIGVATLLFSCKKAAKTADCFRDEITTRIITNKPALIKHSQYDKYYILEEGTIDNRLILCNLTKEFKINDLQVIISGEVKATVQAGPGPCCRENFVITKIPK